MEQRTAKVRIGIGGWELDVLDRLLYGNGSLSAEEKLSRYARTFDATVVRATFWDGDLGAGEASAWARAVRHNPAFRFIVKLHHHCTHQQNPSASLRARIRSLLQALEGEGRLGGLLAQFPYSFTNTSTNRFAVIRIAEVFRGFPLHVEFRHASWHQEVAFLEEHRIQIVSADLPRIRQFIPFQTGTHGCHLLLRLHGRNEKGWLQNGLDARYDYLYNARELIELRRRIESMLSSTPEVTVIFNNTTGGHALVNALQLLSALRGGKPVDVPPSTLAAFPQLRQIADPAHLDLFTPPEMRTAV